MTPGCWPDEVIEYAMKTLGDKTLPKIGRRYSSSNCVFFSQYNSGLWQERLCFWYFLKKILSEYDNEISTPERCFPHWDNIIPDGAYKSRCFDFKASYVSNSVMCKAWWRYASENHQDEKRIWFYPERYSDFLELFDFLIKCRTSQYQLASAGYRAIMNSNEAEIKSGSLKHYYWPKHQRLEEIECHKQFLLKEIEDHRAGNIYFRDCLEKEIQYLRSVQSLLDFQLKAIYDRCVQEHKNCYGYYQRGMYSFCIGDYLDALEDIRKYIEIGGEATCELKEFEGTSCIELGLYQEAIAALSEAIKLNPKSKSAYFERAIAYFEKGKFSESLEDYLKSEIRITRIDPKDSISIAYAKGLTQGILRGAWDETKEFVPSMLDSMTGLCHGAWALVTNYEEVSKEMVETSRAVLEFLRTEGVSGAVQLVVPELKELMNAWENLPDRERGEKIGYVIGKYGIDALYLGGAAKGAKTILNLRRANAALTLSSIKQVEKAKEVEKFSRAWWKQTKTAINELRNKEGRIEQHISAMFKGQVFTEKQTRKILNMAGIKNFKRPKGVPRNSTVAISNTGGGMIYMKEGTTLDHSIYVRVMPGNPNAKFSVQKNAYVIQRKGDKTMNIKGELVDWRKPEAHIPLEIFEFRGWYND